MPDISPFRIVAGIQEIKKACPTPMRIINMPKRRRGRQQTYKDVYYGC